MKKLAALFYPALGYLVGCFAVQVIKDPTIFKILIVIIAFPNVTSLMVNKL